MRQMVNIRPTGTSGFSLVELMVVAGVIGIVSALAVTNVREASEQQMLPNAMTVAANGIRNARGLAVAQGRAIGLRFQSDRIEVFRWSDTDSDYLLDWSDTDGDGFLGSGEGEVSEAFPAIRVDIERGTSPAARPIQIVDGAPGSFGPVGTVCERPAVFGDTSVVLFDPRDGRAIGADGFECPVRIYLENTESQQWGVIDIAASGAVQSSH